MARDFLPFLFTAVISVSISIFIYRRHQRFHFQFLFTAVISVSISNFYLPPSSAFPFSIFIYRRHQRFQKLIKSRVIFARKR
jgi:uncharacterized BrkB/YihY/UPF0761 family membrane protein